MSTIRVYDPPMCCSTGVCGPDEDDELAQFASTLEWAKKAGVTVDRFNLGHQPGEFVTNGVVKDLIASDGVDILPVVMVGDDIVSKGDYPTRSAMAGKLGLEDTGGTPDKPSACCEPGDKAAQTSSCC